MVEAVQGVGELIAQVQGLGHALESKGVRQALREAGKPVLTEDRARMNVDTGLLRQSLGNKVIKQANGNYALLTGARHTRITKKRKKAGFTVRKGIRKKIAQKGLSSTVLGVAQMADPARYLHLVDLGHAVRVGRGSIVRRILGRYSRWRAGRNRVPGSHALELGQQAAAGSAEAAMAQSLKQFIETQVAIAPHSRTT